MYDHIVSDMDQMILSTTHIIPGYKVVKILGIVSGMTARTRGIGGKFIAGIQSMVGGEVSAFTEEIVKARDESLRRIVEQAKGLGTNAIIGVDFETSEVFETVVLISATGTAILVEPEQLPPPP
ncbi:MAG: YbjQ family protein [Thermoproteota archaeon]